MIQSEPAKSVWTQDELRLAVLQLLFALHKNNPDNGGAAGKQLMDAFQLDYSSENISNLELALSYLRDKEYIGVGERVFLITPKGIEFLTQTLAINTLDFNP